MLWLLCLWMTQPIGPEALKADLDQLKTALETRHGGYDRYATRAALDALFAQTRAKLDQPMDEVAFFGLLFPIISLIGDGHTQLSLSSATSNRLDRLPMRLPFKIKMLDRRAYLYWDYSPERDLPVGAELLAINGHPMGEITRRMMPLLSSDGRNESLKRRRMESTFWFALRFRILYGPYDTFELLLRDPKTGVVSKRVVGGITNDALNRRYRQRYRDQVQEVSLSYRFEQDLAILRLGAFQTKTVDGQNLSVWLANFFGQLKANHKLVIDLRGNGGGYDAWGRVLTQHLVQKPFRYYASLQARSGDGWRDVNHENLGLHQPRKPHWGGRIYVLMDEGCFSAAGETITALHQHTSAVFIGKESGGGYLGNTSGSTSQITLSNSGIRVFIPLHRYVMHTAEKDNPAPRRGMLPDHDIGPTIADLLAGRDPVMDFVRALASTD